MFSYSDCVLAERPWAYWPLNDPSLENYNEIHLLMDVSGNQRHLSAKNEKIEYQVPIEDFNDSQPVKGVSIDGPITHNANPRISESSGYLYLASGAPQNNIESSYYYSHDLFFKKTRFEFLINEPSIANNIGGACALASYPILSIAGIVLRMNTFWEKQLENSTCTIKFSYISLNCTTYTTEYQLSGEQRISYYTNKLIWQTANDGHIGSHHFIVDLEYIDDRNIFFKIFHNGSSSDFLYTLDESYITSFGYIAKERFYYKNLWTELAIISTTGISNLSIYYGKTIDAAYKTKSELALRTPYIPSFFPTPFELSDQVITSQILNSYPNSALAQLDSLLIRGISHRKVTQINTNLLESGKTEVEILFSSYYNDYIIIQDYKIGEIISIER